MADFPTSLPSFTNPASTDYLNSPAHATQHADANDEIVALATKLGTGAATSTTTNKILYGNGVGTSDWNTPDTAGLVDKASAQTIAGVKTFGAATKQTLKSNTDGATVTFDLDVANIHTVTLGGNRTLALSNADTGQVFIIRLVQDGTGSRTVTWFSTIDWSGGSAPTLSTGVGAIDVFGFICTGANTYDGFTIGLNLS